MQLPSYEQRAFFEQAATQYQSDLASDTPAQAYLKSRGITRQAAVTFRLGVVRSPLPGHEMHRDRLAIPYLTPAGVITFSFRCLRGHNCKDTVLRVTAQGKEIRCKKYAAPEGMDRTLYNVLDFKKDPEALYVCEGELDTLTLSMCGYAAIGVPGVSNWKPQFTRCFADAPRIFCIADGDDAGFKLGRFLSAEVKAKILRPPQGEDVNSMYVKGGEDAIKRWLAGAT